MHKKIISQNSGRKQAVRLLNSKGETFEDVWTRMALKPEYLYDQGNPRQWPCEDELEEAYARELAHMSLEELDKFLIDILEEKYELVGATALQKAPTIFSPIPHLISFIDSLGEPVGSFAYGNFVHVFTTPYCRISMERAALERPSSKESLGLDETLEQLCALLHYKAFLRELARRWR